MKIDTVGDNSTSYIVAEAFLTPPEPLKSLAALRASFASLSRQRKRALRVWPAPLSGLVSAGLRPRTPPIQMFQAYRLIILGEFKSIMHSVQAPRTSCDERRTNHCTRRRDDALVT